MASSDESETYFYKMIGDFYRYMASIAYDEQLESVKAGALESYMLATKSAESLHPCNMIKLGLALNFSVFYFEVMENHKESCEVNVSALDAALEKIDEVDEETYRDAKSILELLKENLAYWKDGK